MKRLVILTAALLMVGLPLSGWAADPARKSLRAGAQAYEKKDYVTAAKDFEAAAQSAPDQKLDPATAHYNQANALMKQGKAQEASIKYQDALHSEDLGLQSRACYNRGNALSDMAGIEEKANQLEPAQQAIEEAIRMYENAMTLAPDDKDAKINYELALQKKQELEKKIQQQQQNQEKQDQQKKEEQKQDQQKKEQEKNQQDQDQGQDQQPQKPEEQQQAQPQKPTQEMTPQEARMMLDAMKQEEQASREKMRLMLGQPVPVDKDW